MSIHDIIEKINTDKREIAFSKLKGRVMFLGMIVLSLVQIGVLVWVWSLWR